MFSKNLSRNIRFVEKLQSTRNGRILRGMSQGQFARSIVIDEDPCVGGVLDSVAKDSASYKSQTDRFHQLTQESAQGGGTKGIDRHVRINKKMLVRERIKMLIDPGTEFFEIAALAGFEMIYGDLPAAGIAGGIGKVNGVYCLISGNDATVKAGTYFPITVKKSYRLQEIAKANRLPCIYMPDSGGAFLPMQSEIFPDKKDGGRAFYSQATMSAEGIPQIAIVCGSCTAGGAYNPTMSDYAINIDRIGKIFLGGPPLVKAATGEIVTDEDLGGAFMHSSVSGCTDYFARDEKEAFEMCRDVVESLNMNCVTPPKNYKEPLNLFKWEDFEGKIPYSKLDVYKIISSLTDQSTFNEFKAFYGVGLITGTGYIQGNIVGVISNTDDILEAEALKATQFLNICNRRGIPVLFLQNSLPSVNKTSELMCSPNVIKSRGSMSAAVATLSVPKISVTISACYEDDHLLMCGPSFSPNLSFMWPATEISSFDMSFGNVEDSRQDAFYAAFNILTDALIAPSMTRSVLGQSLNILKQQKLNPKRDGLFAPVFRM